MFRRQSSVKQRLAVATALALGLSGAALADDSSMNRIGGDSYAYFGRPAAAVAASPDWRQSHPRGLTEREVQALSSSDLSAFVARLDPPVFARTPADSSWRQNHPNGLTERELQELSSSALAIWHAPSAIGATAQRSIAQSPSAERLVARDRRH